MTRGTASPSHDQEHPTTGVPVVRPTFAQPSPGGITSSPRFAKILVILLAVGFVIASVAFIIQLSNARREPATAPGTPAIPAATTAAGVVDGTLTGAVVNAGAPLEPSVPAAAIADLLQASPSPAASLAPVASPLPSTVPDPLASIDPLAETSAARRAHSSAASTSATSSCRP